MKKWVLKYRYSLLTLFAIISIAYYYCLPATLFENPYSTVIESADHNLLSASIAPDGQWRFPQTDTVASKFREAIIAFEDKRFMKHPGVDVLSLGRASIQNIKAGRIVSGGSTISMQVVRLSRKNKPRTFLQKTLELILATRLEWRYSKNEIVSLYAAHAPFGGNVVGLEAASWRYFGRDPQTLSWAEAAMLAVLPNAPSLIHPGKNRKLLKIKRDNLLDKLHSNGTIDALTCSLAKEESLPDAPHRLPRHARHLISRADRDGHPGEKIHSTIDFPLQLRVEQILQDHHQRLSANQIFNGAILVIDVQSGSTLAYVGNTQEENVNGSDVDVIVSPRSTGSILKPFLYAAMLEEGKMLPKTLLPDIPVVINGFAPQNFSREFDGAVPADKALIRSLNVPAVHMLRDYRYEKFHNLLQQMGMTTLDREADHYGLSLILGGGECTLWEVTGMYASMARTLNNFFERPGKNRYRKSDFHHPDYVFRPKHENKKWEENSWLTAASISLTFETMKELYRPGEETGWRYFSSAKPIAWKTGTSFGFRDGWAIGVTPDFAVGIWVGNADGEGRPGLTGIETAAPILFDVFSVLPGHRWFEKPLPELAEIVTCRKSGYRISENCEEADTLLVPRQGLATSSCPFHKKVHVTRDEKFRINSACASIDEMKHQSWFVLPPIQEYYFRPHNTSYRSLPPIRKDCIEASGLSGMDMIYPKADAKIYIPRELDGKPGKSVFELAHRSPGNMVYWHMDGEYVGATKKIHQLALNPPEGKHTLTLVDENGESLVRQFEVLSKLR